MEKDFVNIFAEIQADAIEKDCFTADESPVIFDESK